GGIVMVIPGSALLSRWGRRLLLHGRTLCGRVGGSGGIRLGNRSMEPLALLMRSMGKRDVARSAAAWFPSTAMPPHYRIALECHAGSPPPAWPPFLFLPRGSPRLLRTPRVDAVHRMGDRVIVKSLGIERAGHLQHLGRLLAELPGRNGCLLARSLIGEAGLPSIERALRVTRPGASEMVDHRVLIAQDRGRIARPKFAVDGIPASRTDDHQIGLKQQRLLSFDIPGRIAIPVG